MKKLFKFVLILLALALPLNADSPAYPDWEWEINHWVYTGSENPPPLPPPQIPPRIG